MDFLLDPQTWASLLTLTALEIVLGIDNLLFIVILSNPRAISTSPSPFRSASKR